MVAISISGYGPFDIAQSAMTMQGRSRNGGADDRAPPRFTNRETTMHLRRLAFAAVTAVVTAHATPLAAEIVPDVQKLDRVTAGATAPGFEPTPIFNATPGVLMLALIGPTIALSGNGFSVSFSSPSGSASFDFAVLSSSGDTSAAPSSSSVGSPYNVVIGA